MTSSSGFSARTAAWRGPCDSCGSGFLRSFRTFLTNLAGGIGQPNRDGRTYFSPISPMHLNPAISIRRWKTTTGAVQNGPRNWQGILASSVNGKGKRALGAPWEGGVLGKGGWQNSNP